MRTMSVETSKAMLKQCAARKIKIIKMPKNKNYDRGLFKCACGAEYEATASYVLSRIGCPECVKKNAYAKMSATNSGKPSKRKKTHAQHVAELKLKNPTIRCIGTYVDSYTRIAHQCRVCGSIEDRYPHNAMRFGCSVCAGNTKKTVDDYNAELQSHGIHFEACEYSGARTKTMHACTRCNKFTLMASPTNALKAGKLCCPICDSTTFYTIEAGDRIFRLRGFERFVLPRLLKVYTADQILEDASGKIPAIPLGTGKLHRPDFYIPHRNLMIEVKSIATLGLGNTFHIYKGAFNATKKKKRAALKAGYKYILALMTNKGTRISLPENWETYSKSDLEKHISSLGFNI